MCFEDAAAREFVTAGIVSDAQGPAYRSAVAPGFTVTFT